jgi:dTDP-4-dehydrorhamnose reductase
MSTLVIGASGQVGKCLMRKLGADAVGTGHTRATGRLIPLDLADVGAIGRLIRNLKPEAIYVPGGVTAVDWCEAHEAEARRICVDGSVAIQEAALAVGANAVHFSTDYVFSGELFGPYEESDPPDPVSAYGRVKLEAERALGRHACIIRTSMVYSDDPDSKNFHNFVRNTLAAGKEVKAFSDQAGSPTYAPDLAEAAIELQAMPPRGVIHYAGPEVMNRVKFAQLVARAYGLQESLIRAVTSDELPLPARRPKLKAGLRVGRGPHPLKKEPVTVEMALEDMKKREPRR